MSAQAVCLCRLLQWFCALASLLLMMTAAIASENNLGSLQQGLVGGRVTSPEVQERFGLVSLSVGCSGSLLRNEWVITAAHCVDRAIPEMPGQFSLRAQDSVRVDADWASQTQSRRSTRIITFRPSDIAILRLDRPLSRYGKTEGFSQTMFADDQAPYFGTPTGVPVVVFGRGIQQFAMGSGDNAVPSQTDGLYRAGLFRTSHLAAGDLNVAFPTEGGQQVAGGDSGGPAFAEVLNRGPALVGVTSICRVTCIEGKPCGGNNGWTWVTSTPECQSALVAPVRDEINRYLGAASTTPGSGGAAPVSGFIGTFSATPAGFQPIWVYVTKPNGDLLWYRKDSGDAPWQGPVHAGTGWNFKDVVPAGGNAFYALTEDGRLNWYRHDGFNDGSLRWTGPVAVGEGWRFSSIFAGGEGVLYAIREDGSLVWYRHRGYRDARVGDAWDGPTAVGVGWQDFRQVFSEGKGVIYALQADGALLRYVHSGHATGGPQWQGPVRIARGWQVYRRVVPVGDGVLLAISDDGSLTWFRHDPAGVPAVSGGRLAPVRITGGAWEGPTRIGTGWQDFRQVWAALPRPADEVR